MTKEAELYAPITKLFGESYFAASDIPLGSKRIDLVLATRDLKKLIAVEVKVKNWNEALRQALNYQLGVNESYVAVYEKYSNSIKRQKFENLGIGLIVVDDNQAKIIVPAKPSQRKTHNYVTLTKAFVAEKIQKETSTTTNSRSSTSPLKFYLWYVPIERRYFEDLSDCYDGFIINAHILEHCTSAFSALCVRFNKPFIIIPDTHAFQLAPITLFLDAKGGIRSSWEKLANNYGSLINLILKQGRNLRVNDFISVTGSWEQSLFDLVKNVIGFQKNRVPFAVHGLARFFDIPTQAITTYLVAPYFFFTSINDPWYKISLQMAKESTKHKGQHKLFVVLCMSRSILMSNQAISTIINDYSQLNFDGFLLWIEDFMESEEPAPLLYGFIKLVNNLKSMNKEVINLHGGFFSSLLYYYGLDGFASGVCYRESASPLEFPTGGPAGGPIPKYYIFPLKVKMAKVEAGLAIQEIPSLRCSCKICNGQIDYMFDVATPDTISRDLMKRHFLLTKKLEREYISKNSLADTAWELKEAYDTYETKADIVPVEHLKRWVEVITKK